MPLWRIRIRLSDDPRSRAQLDEALAGQQVKDITFEPRDADSAEMAGDVMLVLPHDEDLGTTLSALHRISPQVFVSRVDDDRDSRQRPALTSQFRKNGLLSRRVVSSRD